MPKKDAASDNSLTAREVQEALEERISKGLYVQGERLPPVRSLAAEFGTSPSTVSRALQGMMRNGWLEVHERQFVRVCTQLTPQTVRTADILRSIKAIAHKWKLWGGQKEELLDTIHDVVGTVFEDEAEFVFAECNTVELDSMMTQLTRELPSISLQGSLIEDLDRASCIARGSVILVPYYHYLEVKNLVGPDVPVIPVHFSPSTETLDEILTLPAGSQIVVFGHNKRSVSRISGIVRDYVDVKITGLTSTEGDKLAQYADTATALVAVESALNAVPSVPSFKKTVLIRFSLETSLLAKLRDKTLTSTSPAVEFSDKPPLRQFC